MLKPFEKYCRYSGQNLCGLYQGLCQDVRQTLEQDWLTVFTQAATQHTTQRTEVHPNDVQPNSAAVKFDASLGSLC